MAEMFLIFCLGRLDVLPVTDLGIRKAMQKTYSLSELPKPAEMLSIAQPWKPYRTVATWYLWLLTTNELNIYFASELHNRYVCNSLTDQAEKYRCKICGHTFSYI